MRIKSNTPRRLFNNIGPEYYKKARIIIDSWSDKDKRVPLDRKDWDQCHMSMAHEASKRSPDAQTKVGAFLTNETHEPVSAGYNGFPKGFPDYRLPNMRPDKYDWMVHAEMNAILNAARQGKLTKDTIMYCTHQPCKNCTLSMWQAGIKHVVFDNSTTVVMIDNDEYKIWMATFDILSQGRMVIRGIDFKE